ncbi:MAG: FxsA family protein [Pseudomonadota bacterium]
MRFIFLLIFILVPILEIWLFIQVDSLIGLWPTLASVVLTAVIGTWLMRMQGFQVLMQARGALEQSQFPLEQVIHGVFLLIAGLLLLTPGFFTDAIGFACLVPPLRLVVAYAVWSKLKDHVHVVHPGMGPEAQRRDRPRGGTGPVIDGEIIDDDVKEDPPRPGDPNSPWRQ